MYLQFSDLGLVTCVQYSGGNVVYYGHHPKAEWAVAHHDRKAAEARARAEAEERRHRETLRSSQRNIVIGWALGLVTALVSFALAHVPAARAVAEVLALALAAGLGARGAAAFSITARARPRLALASSTAAWTSAMSAIVNSLPMGQPPFNLPA